MYKYLLALSIVIFSFGCGEDDPIVCNTGFSGSNCETEIEPSNIIIESVTITRWPQFEAGGGNWDLDGSGPDLTFSIGPANSTVFTSTQFVENAVQGQSYLFNNLSIVLPNPGFTNYFIRLFDFDILDADDQMGSIGGLLYQRGRSFPTTIDIDDNGVIAFRLRVRYQF